MKRFLTAMLSIMLVITSVLTFNIKDAKALYYTSVKTVQCKSYNTMKSKQLSGMTKTWKGIDLSIKSTDKVKDYGFKVTIPEDGFANILTSFQDKTYWNWQVRIFRDATEQDLLYGTDVTAGETDNSYVDVMHAGDYYVHITIKYNQSAVTAEQNNKTTPTTTTSGSGMVSTPVTHDPNISKNSDGTYTVRNTLCVGATYVLPEDCVTLTTSSLNGVSTVYIDATNFAETSGKGGTPYIQYQQDEDASYDFWSYNDSDVWELNKELWGNKKDTSRNIHKVPGDSTSEFNKTTLYLKKLTGKYTFRIAQPVDGEPNYNAVVITADIDCSIPSVKGVADESFYTSSRTIKYADKGSGIKSATLNGKAFKSGRKVSAEGKYKLVVKDKAGNVKECTFYIDKTAPKIKGIKNKATYRKKPKFTITDSKSGVAMVKVKVSNNKSGFKFSDTYTLGNIKNKTVLSQKWIKSLVTPVKGTNTITVWDRAGNKRTVTFYYK